jgi:hypothetical protein
MNGQGETGWQGWTGWMRCFGGQLLGLLLLGPMAGGAESSDPAASDKPAETPLEPVKPLLSKPSADAAPPKKETCPGGLSEEGRRPAQAVPSDGPLPDPPCLEASDDTPATRDAATEPTQAKQPAAPPQTLSADNLALRDDLRRCLAFYFHHLPENNVERSPWGVMHALVAFGVDTPLLVGDQRVNAIGWLCWNQPCYNMRLFSANDAQLGVHMGPGYQGHEGQFLMMMAWSRVPKTFGLKVDGYDFTLEDLIRYEQRTCRAGTELCFKLTGLVHYTGTNAAWQNDQGEAWTIERMIAEELLQPVIGSACGGTHRLECFGYSLRKRLARGEPVTGHWARAQKYVDDYVAYAHRLQNADGSFSTKWFEGPENRQDPDRKLNTTGHTLEWLLLSLPDDRLDDPRVLRAARFLTDLLWYGRGRPWEIGPKGHGLHALVLYDERVFGSRPGPERVAEFSRLLEANRLR